MSFIGGLTGFAALMSMSLLSVLVKAAEPIVTPAATPGATNEQQPVSTSKPLNLRAPDITQLYSQEEIKRFLSRTMDPDIEEVEVEDARKHEGPAASPEVWGAIAAPFWALLHPTQAWRIIAPIPPDRAKYIGNEKPDATDPNLRVLPPP